MMRHETHAYRVCYGTPIFLTFSPSERDSTIMLRLARTREDDPAMTHDDSRDFQTRDKPDLDVDFLKLDPEMLAQVLPSYDQRRAMLARDPLACADGFWALVQLALRHLFGVRWCPNCPHCAKSKAPCMDGRHPGPRGCTLRFHRVPKERHAACAFPDLPAVLPPVHAPFQAGGHGKGRLYGPGAQVQSLHRPRSRPLRVEERASAGGGSLARVSRLARDAQPPQLPERPHPICKRLAATVPQCGRGGAPETKAAPRALGKDARRTQAPADPLPRPQGRNQVQGGFPRDKQLTEETLLVCQGLARQMDMPAKGKRSMRGSLWGPVNDPDLNGTHPALLAALRCNSDLQLPYRFPINADTHSASCEDETCPGGNQPVRALVREAQTTQAAQAGYAWDYANRRLPIATQEIREWNKGNKDMVEELRGKPAGYVASRVESRLITDYFGRGCCRGAVECSNLITRHRHASPLHAESVRTAQTVNIPLSFGVELLQAATAEQPWPVEPLRWSTDARKNLRKKVISRCPFWALYGSRGQNARVQQLSAFEFAMHYELKKASHPWSVALQQEAEKHPGKFEVFSQRLVSRKYACINIGLTSNQASTTEFATQLRMSNGSRSDRLSWRSRSAAIG